MLKYKDYCDYDTSRELKELGFVAGLGEDDCGYCLYDDAWHDQVDRPLLYEAQKWLREEKGIGITIFHHYSHDTYEIFYAVELHNTKHWLKTFGEFTDWTQALSEGIKEAVKILKDGNNN